MIPLPRVLALHSTADATLASTTTLNARPPSRRIIQGCVGVQNLHQQHPAVMDIKTFAAAYFLCLRSSNIPAADAINQIPLDPLSNTYRCSSAVAVEYADNLTRAMPELLT